jgi:hypothetical protein
LSDLSECTAVPSERTPSVTNQKQFERKGFVREKEAVMEWVAAVAASVGLGALAGWVYGGFRRLRRREASKQRIPGVSQGAARESHSRGANLARGNGNRSSLVIVGTDSVGVEPFDADVKDIS